MKRADPVFEYAGKRPRGVGRRVYRLFLLVPAFGSLALAGDMHIGYAMEGVYFRQEHPEGWLVVGALAAIRIGCFIEAAFLPLRRRFSRDG